MKVFKQLSLLVVSLSLFACSTQSTNDKPVDIAMEIQNSWQLISVDGQDVSNEINSTLNIDDENKATGKLACNNFFGGVDLEQDQLTIAQMGSTRMLCDEAANNVEMIVTNVLSGGAQVEITDGNLKLVGEQHSLTYSLQK